MRIPCGWVVDGPYDWPDGKYDKDVEERLYKETGLIVKLKEFKSWAGKQIKIWGRNHNEIAKWKQHIFATVFIHTMDHGGSLEGVGVNQHGRSSAGHRLGGIILKRMLADLLQMLDSENFALPVFMTKPVATQELLKIRACTQTSSCRC